MSSLSPAAAVPPPTDDRRWKLVEAAVRRHAHQPSALLEVLHAVQEAFGYIDRPALVWVARSLSLPESKVYGVVSFYPFFSLKPQGEHSCQICTGTACYIKGAGQLLERVRDATGLVPGETTRDGKLSVIAARCLGACGLAPVAQIDGEMAGKVTPAELEQRLREWTGHEA